MVGTIRGVNESVIGPETVDNTIQLSTFAAESNFPVLITPCQTNLATVAHICM